MIYVFLAEGFEEIEALATVDFLRRAELPVQTVGVTGKAVTGSHSIKVEADLMGAEAKMHASLEMIVLPGGMPGTLNLEKSPLVQAFLDFMQKEQRYIAAICAAPSILGHKGLLQGKKAVCFPGFEAELTGAEVLQEPVCVDGKIITARGAGVACEFAYAIAEILQSKDVAEKVWKSMQFTR